MCITGHSYLSEIDFEGMRNFQWEKIIEEMYVQQRQLLQVLLTVCTNKSEDDQHFMQTGKELGLIYGILMKRRCKKLSRVQRVVSICLADERVHQKINKKFHMNTCYNLQFSFFYTNYQPMFIKFWINWFSVLYFAFSVFYKSIFAVHFSWIVFFFTF